MLNTLRNSAGSWFVKILLGILVLSFAVWGVGDIFRKVGREHLADIGGREISVAQFQRAYDNQISMRSNQIGRRLTSEEIRKMNIGEQVIDLLMNTAAIGIHADRLHLGITEAVVADSIKDNPAFQGADGKFDAARFQQLLRENGLNEPRFVALQREDLVHEQIVGALSRGAFVPTTLLDAFNHFSNDERVLKFFILPPEAAGTVDAADDGVLKAYYDENKTSYSAHEYRKFGMLALTPEAIKDSISLSDEDLKASYEATKKAYSTPERRTLQQLIFKDMASAQDGYKKLTEGADFAKLGEEIGMKEADMALGTVTKDQLADKKIAAAAFALEKDKVSEPIDSFSPVIVKATEITPGSEKTFEEVKDQVRDALAKSRGAEEISKLYDKIEDERAGGSKIAEVAQKFNLKYATYTTDRVGAGEDGKKLEGTAAQRDVLKLVFESDVGVESNPVTVPDGNAFVEVLEVIPERQKPFEEVREDVKRDWTAREIRKRMRAKADELVAKAKAGATIDAIAQEFHAEVVTSPAVKRGGTVQVLPRTAVALAFTLAKDGFGTVQMPDGTAQAVLQVTEVKPAAALDGILATNMRDALKRSLTNDITAQYVGGLITEYGARRNERALAQLTGKDF